MQPRTSADSCIPPHAHVQVEAIVERCRDFVVSEMFKAVRCERMHVPKIVLVVEACSRDIQAVCLCACRYSDHFKDLMLGAVYMLSG